MAAPINSNGLTSKQEGFCQSYIETQSYSSAYSKNYSTSGMMEKTVWEKASRLAAKDKVRARLNQLMEKHAEKHEITVERLTKEFLETYSEAREHKQFSAATSALNSLAKMHGHMVERGVIKHQQDVTVLPAAEINAAITEIRKLVAEKKVKMIDVEPKPSRVSLINSVELPEAAE